VLAPPKANPPARVPSSHGEQRKLGRKIAMEEDWLRYGVTARRTRNQRRLAELHALRRKRKKQGGSKNAVPDGEPMFRIHLPPAKSQVRTRAGRVDA
jgi:hypothetical protein